MIIRKILSYIALSSLIALNLAFIPFTFDSVSAQFIQINPEQQRRSIIPLPTDAYSDNFIVAEGDNALEQTANLSMRIIGAGRLLIAGIAILLGLTGIVQMVVAQDKEESVTKAKRIVLYSVIGIAMIALSSDLGKILDFSGGGLLGTRAEVSSRLMLFDDTVRIVITFLKYLIGAVAILMLTITGLQLITLGENEEEAGKAKKNIVYILGGLFALIFVDNIINNVFYNIDRPGDDLTINLGQGVREIVGFTNFMVSWIGPIAVITLVAGGLMYVGSFGNEETQSKAKKMMITSLVGIVAIYGAFGLVSTIISGSL